MPREILADRHETLFYVLLGLIALHLAAILYYLARQARQSGHADGDRRARRAGEDGEAMAPAPLWRFLLAGGARRRR